MKSTHAWFILLLILTAGTRLLLLWPYETQIYPDSPTYLQAARDLLSGDHSVGLGRRTPGYPLVIAIAGEAPDHLKLANAIAGTLTSLLLFYIGLRLTGSAILGFAVGGLHTVNLQQVFHEGSVATEAISALSVIAALALFVQLLPQWRAGRTAMAGSLALSLVSAYALLTRPQFLFMPALLALAALIAARGLRRPSVRSLVAGVAIVMPAAALVVGWASYLHSKTGYFTMSTQSGFGLVNHPIDYIELASDRYAAARDVLVKVRDARIAEVGHSRNTIWYAWPEIQRVTGWTLPEASRNLQRMCTELFVAYPGRYVASVAHAWVDFWSVPIFWRPEAIRPATLRGVLQNVWWVEHKALRAANLAFVLVLAAVVVSNPVRRRLRWDLALTAAALTVLGSSLIQALADQGASSRYALPTQSVVVLVLAVALQRWWKHRRDPGI